tara:strand:- start:158 stop:589 length:432 start_codon:yes stop_codon:yes gene_type:complete
MYLADTPTRSVYEIDYTENGKLTNRRNIYTQPPNLPGGPDGAQTDSEGFVWVVERRAGRVVRVDPTDGRVDVVVLTPGSPSRMGEEQEEFLKVGFLFSKQNIFHNSTATSHSFICKKLLDTSKNLMFVVILDEERGVLSELGF